MLPRRHKGAVWRACLDTPALHAATASADFSTRVWDALTGDELQSFEQKHIVRTCAFSESTTYLMTGGAEKILWIFDLTDQTRHLLRFMDLQEQYAQQYDTTATKLSSVAQMIREE